MYNNLNTGQNQFNANDFGGPGLGDDNDQDQYY
jgi:hypothetical protein